MTEFGDHAAVAQLADFFLVVADSVGRRAADERQRRQVLEHRIVMVKRSLGSALADGREIEAAFVRVRDSMTIEEQEKFFREFLASCDRVVGAAGHLAREAFVDAAGAGHAQTKKGYR